MLADDRRLHRRRAALPGQGASRSTARAAASRTSSTRCARTAARIIHPTTCAAQDSAIWGRAGAVVRPGQPHGLRDLEQRPASTARTTGATRCSSCPRAPRASCATTRRPSPALRTSRTPTSARRAPALLPLPGASRRTRYLRAGRQGRQAAAALGHDEPARRAGAAGRRIGGENQVAAAPGGQIVFTAPRRCTRARTRLFVATDGGTAAYTLLKGRLLELWSNGTRGDEPGARRRPALRVRPGRLAERLHAAERPASPHSAARRPGTGTAPIVTGGRVYLPTGNANDHATSGVLSVYR